MSDPNKEAKRQAEMQLAGQDSDEARAAVKLQRELKKKKDALRKAEKKLKSVKPGDATYAAVVEEVEEAKRAVAELEGTSAPVTASPPAPPASGKHEDALDSPLARDPAASVAAEATSATPQPGPSPTAVSADNDEKEREKEAKRQAEMQLAGQDSDEARAAVKLQRELKKKKDALRKAEKKLKSVKPGDATYAAVVEEVEEAKRAVAELEGGAGAAPEPAKPTAAPAAAPASVGHPAKAAAAVASAAPTDVAPVEDVEGNRAKLRTMVEQAIHSNHGERPMGMRRVSVVHPRVAEAAVMMEEMVIVGGNARTLAMISAFRELIKSTTILAGASLKEIDTTAFEKLIEANFTFLRRKREASSGMRYVKEALVRRLVALRDEVVHQNESQEILKKLKDPREVTLQILGMLEMEFKVSIKTIVEERSVPYVSNSDTILVFGRSSVVEFILLSRACDAQKKPKKVIVIDSAPLFEGKELARKLSEAGIQVTYGLITACCTLMPKCTRVFMGASSVLQNGDVFGRCGTALVAACAKTFRKPVLCFSESYKFVPEVWVGNLAQNTKLMDMRPVLTNDSHADSVGASRSPVTYSMPRAFSPPSVSTTQWGTWPKGGDAAANALSGSISNARGLMSSAYASSSASGYLYDLTPAAYVDMIICEMGCLHTSAIVAAIKDREGRDTSPLSYFTKD